MSIPDPANAPPRPDLNFLRHRARPQAPSPPDAHVALEQFVHGDGPRPHPHHPAPAPTIDLDNLLDLSPSAPSRPASQPSPPAAPSTLSPAPPTPTLTPTPIAQSTAKAPTRTVRRARGSAALVLNEREPVVRLTRVQSGVGVLTIEAACSPAIGDLRLGCAFQLRSGQSSVVQHASGVSSAPTVRPAIIGSRGQYERLVLDLAQSRNLERLIVYGFSDSGGSLQWGGTLVVTTFGGSRMEIPLDRPPSSAVTVLMSLYNIDGEFVVRAELEEIAGTVRDAVAAFGFDRISWLDSRTPVV